VDRLVEKRSFLAGCGAVLAGTLTLLPSFSPHVLDSRAAVFSASVLDGTTQAMVDTESGIICRDRIRAKIWLMSVVASVGLWTAYKCNFWHRSDQMR